MHISHIQLKMYSNERPTGLLVIFAALFFLVLSSCGDNGSGNSDTGNETTVAGIQSCADLDLAEFAPPAEVVADDANDHMTILNNDADLKQLFNCLEVDVPYSDSQNLSVIQAQSSSRNGHWKNGFSLTLVGEIYPPTIVGKATAFPWNMPLNDLASGGTYSGTGTEPPYVNYRVEIDGTAPDTFRWSDDNGSTWQATEVAITAGTAQTLNNGVTVTFGADTGHTAGNYWNFTAGILQATSVSMKANHAIVSYSMIGAPFLGGVQIFRLFYEFPFLRSQALFHDTDINAVSVSGQNVYAVGASEPVVPPYHPAIMEVISMEGTKFVLTDNNRLDLTSFAGTSVIHNEGNGKVYATSGNAGGLTIVDASSFTIDSEIPLDDARWVHFDDVTDTLVVAQGGGGSNTNGEITVYDITTGTPEWQRNFNFTGADIAESKSTVEVVGGKAILAAGSGGVQVMSTVSGDVLATIPIPSALESGINDPNLRVANAVTVDDDIMFISFGEAGVYVAQADENFDASGSEGPVNLSLLGKLQFGSLQSANHVAFRENYLYIASGLGGLKIVRVKGI
ncbi:MAG: hypothetical protein JSW20_06950 [Nitrospiraceae bacterium]|nr:MAG: hypothetical protein JSW20_06950 [Nitrospiraceae bacterium]